MLRRLLFNRQTPFWLIAFSVMTGLTLPILIQDGMFMDAMLYTSVSHNLSVGIGTFWFPKFSVYNIAGLSSFHEQPPLVFGIQSLFFEVLGDGMYVERFYTFFTMCVGAALIVVLWKNIFRLDGNLKKIGWLPAILWITVPVCFWSYSNNMHENTLTIFTLAAVITIYRSFHAEKFQLLMWILSGVFVFLSTLSKGFPGFFPIAVPILFWFIIRKSSLSKALLQTSIIILVPVIIYAVLFLLPESKESLSVYLFKRAFHRINEVPTVDTRFYILFRLFTELLPQLLFVGIIIMIAKLKKIEMRFSEQYRTALFFLSIGLASSVPLMLTLVQKGFYFVPSLPYFAIGLSILIGPVIYTLTDRLVRDNRRFRIALWGSILLLSAVITLSLMQIGKASRNKELLQDVYAIGNVVEPRTVVSISKEMWNDWSLQCYLARYYSISLESGYNRKYCIIDRSLNLREPVGYREIPLPTTQYTLYIRDNNGTWKENNEPSNEKISR